MSSYTRTRHTMLAELAGSSVQRLQFSGLDPIWVDGTKSAIRGNEQRAATWLWNEDYAAYREGQYPHAEGLIELTSAGTDLLGLWDSEHPDVLSEIAGEWRVVGSRAKTDGDPEARITITNGPISLDVRTAETRIAAAIAARLTTDQSLADPDHPLAPTLPGVEG